ncbi:uncharacterized protein [Erythrolamprus reginae]|uniref:uncharacterized protein n=1 Tax=Erythrolamprus reginae TaxID=121349 RepID=UPI00396C8AE6
MALTFLLLVLATVNPGESSVGASSHSLKFFSTAISEPSQGEPQFVSVGYVDDQLFSFYDSNSHKIHPRVPWMEKEDPKYRETETQVLHLTEEVCRESLEILRSRYDQNKSLHTLHGKYGCNISAEGRKSGFNLYGYDGKTFITFNTENVTWVALDPQAHITQRKWDVDTGYNQRKKAYLEEKCIKWLEKYLSYQKEPLQTTGASSHSLKFFSTAISEPSQGEPQFVSVGYVDDQLFSFYDSNSHKIHPRVPWMEKEDPKYRETETQVLHLTEEVCRESLEILRSRYDQNKSLHTLHGKYGCNISAEGRKSGFNLYGYDGKTFITFNTENVTWVALDPQAHITQRKWDVDTGYNQRKKAYLEEKCIKWLEKYLSYQKEPLQTTEPTTSEPTTSEPTTSEPTTSEPTNSEPTNPEPTNSESTNSKSNLWLIIGCVVAALILLCVIAGIVVFFKRRQDNYNKAPIFDGRSHSSDLYAVPLRRFVCQKAVPEIAAKGAAAAATTTEEQEMQTKQPN